MTKSLAKNRPIQKKYLEKMIKHGPTPTLLYKGEDLIFANLAWEEFIGFKKEEAQTLEDMCWKIFPGKEEEMLTKIREARVKKLTRKNEHFLMTTKDSDKVCVSVNAVTIGNDSSEPLRLITFTDITQEEHLRMKLLKKKAKLEMSLAVSETGTYSWDFSSGAVVADAQTLNIFGLSPNDTLTFEKFINSIHPNDRTQVEDMCANALETGDPFDLVYRIQLADRTIRWIADKGTCLHDSDNKPSLLIGAVQDITKIRTPFFNGRLLTDSPTEAHSDFFAKKIMEDTLDQIEHSQNLANEALSRLEVVKKRLTNFAENWQSFSGQEGIDQQPERY